MRGRGVVAAAATRGGTGGARARNVADRTLLALFGQSYQTGATSTSSSSPGPADDRVRACGSVRAVWALVDRARRRPRAVLAAIGHKPTGWVRLGGWASTGTASFSSWPGEPRSGRRLQLPGRYFAFSRTAPRGSRACWRPYGFSLRHRLPASWHRRWAGLFATGRGAFCCTGSASLAVSACVRGHGNRDRAAPHRCVSAGADRRKRDRDLERRSSSRIMSFKRPLELAHGGAVVNFSPRRSPSFALMHWVRAWRERRGPSGATA